MRCFECQGVAFPRDCTHVVECGADEYCSTKQIVTTTGNVVFSTGCLRRSLCPSPGVSLIGKRAGNSIRSTDITTCIECCKDEFCNRMGCGASEIPPAQRGAYCFNCDTVVDANTCSDVTICSKMEVCMLYTPVEYASLPQTVYKGQCQTQLSCDVVSKMYSNQKCPPLCCNTDFCNDHCGIPSNISMTKATTRQVTQTSQTTLQVTQTSQMLTTRTNPPTVDVTTSTRETTIGPESTSTLPPRPCKTDGGYLHLHNSEADLCVQIVKMHAYWNEARTNCTNQGNDLVALDTHAKALLLRTFLSGHDDFNRQAYWIGANNFQKANQFSWVNHAPINSSEADWEPGEPDNNSEECVCMYRDSHADRNYQWHDQLCKTYRCNYICQRL